MRYFHLSIETRESLWNVVSHIEEETESDRTGNPIDQFMFEWKRDHWNAECILLRNICKRLDWYMYYCTVSNKYGTINQLMCSFAIVFLSPNVHVRYQLSGTIRFLLPFYRWFWNGHALKIQTTFLWSKQIRTQQTCSEHTVLHWNRGECGAQTKMRDKKRKQKRN